MKKYKLHIFIITSFALTFLIYNFENKVNNLNKEIIQKVEQIKKTEDYITVLEAEWSFQNNPKRLALLTKNINKSSNYKMKTPRLMHLTNIKNIKEKKVFFSQNQNLR